MVSAGPGGAASENVLQGGRDHPSLNPGAQHFALTSRGSRCLYSRAQSAGPSAFRCLRRFAWGRPVSKRDVPGQACHTTSAACSPRYGFAVLNLAAIPPHICREESRQKCSGHPGSSPLGCWRRGCGILSHKRVRQYFRQRHAQASHSLQHRLPQAHAPRHPQRRGAPSLPGLRPGSFSLRGSLAMGRPGPGPGGSLPIPQTAGLCRGLGA